MSNVEPQELMERVTKRGGAKMNWRILLLSLCISFLLIQVAHAIPPPWLIEEWKAEADVIAIGRATEIDTVIDVGHFNRRVGVDIIKVLKTDVNVPDQDTCEDRQANVFYSTNHDNPTIIDGLECWSTGGIPDPTPAVGEIVLVFLKRLEGKDEFSFVSGNPDYIRLSSRSEEELYRVTQNITQCRESSEKIENDKLREAMVDYYCQAIVIVYKSYGDTHE